MANSFNTVVQTQDFPLTLDEIRGTDKCGNQFNRGHARGRGTHYSGRGNHGTKDVRGNQGVRDAVNNQDWYNQVTEQAERTNTV